MIPLYEAVDKSLKFYMDTALNRFKNTKHRFVYWCSDNERYYYRYPRKCSHLIKIRTEYIADFISKKDVVEIMKWIIDNRISILVDIYDPISRQYIFDCGLLNIFQNHVVVALWRTCCEEILKELEKFTSAPFKTIFVIGLEEYLNNLLGISKSLS